MTALIHDPGQDRIVTEVWAWVARDPATGLESLCAVLIDGLNFQAVSTSRTTAERLESLIDEAKNYTGKEVRLVRFVRAPS